MFQSIETPSKTAFGLFEVDLHTGELWKAGRRIKIQTQPFKVLAALLERPGEVVSREELQVRVWGRETTVDFDHSIGTAINKIREALGDSADNPRFIETLARRGYRFIAPVSHPPTTLTPIVAVATTGTDELTPISNLALEPKPRSSLAAETADVQPPSRVRRTWQIATGTALGMVAAAAAGYYAASWHTSGTPIRITQITQNGRISPGAPSMENLPAAVTDGVHIFAPVISDGRAVLSQVSIDSGDVQGAVPANCFPVAWGIFQRTVPEYVTQPSISRIGTAPVGSADRGRIGPAGLQRPRPRRHLDAGRQGHPVCRGQRTRRDPSPGWDFDSVCDSARGRAFWMRWSPDGKLLRFTMLDPIDHTLSL